MNCLKIVNNIIQVPNVIYNTLVLKLRNVSYEKKLQIHGFLFVRGRGSIKIGNNVTINSSLKSNPIGGNTRTIIHCNGKLTIGNNVGLSNCAIVCQNQITIEDWVKIGGNVSIYDTDFHSVNYIERRKPVDYDIKKKPVTIKEDAFIGAHSIILKGVTIGKRSVIAAGSVVTKSVPDDEMWGGCPAKFIKKII